MSLIMLTLSYMKDKDKKKGLNAKFYLCECVTKETVCLTTVLLCGSLYFSNDKLYLGPMNDRQMFSLRGCVSSNLLK